MQSLKTPQAPEKVIPSSSTPPKAPARNGSLADKAQIAFFALVILAFAVGTWQTPSNQVSEDENRTLATLPKWPSGKPRWKNLAPLPAQFDAFYSDRMMDRTLMVKCWNWLLYAVVGVSPNETVTIGDKGWLYFLGDGSEPVIRHETPFSQDEIAEWKKVLAYRKQLLEKNGIKYFFVCPPDKDSVYPEYLPKVWRPIHPQSRLDQLTDELKNAKDIDFLNLTPVLLEHKNEGDIYYKTDTHWNDHGGFIGYREIMSHLTKWFPQLEPIASNRVFFDHVPHIKGDCAKLMGLYGWIVDDAPVARLKGAKEADKKILEPVDVSGKDRATGHEQPIPVFCNMPKKVHKLVFIHDSFGDGIKSFLAGHFDEIVEMRQDDISFDIENILAQKPDLVIQEAVERHVAQFTPSMIDWRVWAVQTIQAREPKEGNPVWLNIAPSTPEVNVNRFVRVPRHHGRMVNPTSPRQYSDKGDEVKFDPNQALYFEWYVLKDGDQGFGFRDPQSAKNYAHLCDFVRNSGKFEKVSEMKLLDKSALSLWRQKQ